MIHPSARADRGDILILGGHVDVDDRAPVAVVEPGIAGLVGHRRRGAAHEIEHFLIEDQRLVERGGADIDMADAVDHEIKPTTIRPSACRVGDSALSCRSEEHTSELQSLIRNSYAVFCLKQNTATILLTITPNKYL